MPNVVDRLNAELKRREASRVIASSKVIKQASHVPENQSVRVGEPVMFSMTADRSGAMVAIVTKVNSKNIHVSVVLNTSSSQFSDVPCMHADNPNLKGLDPSRQQCWWKCEFVDQLESSISRLEKQVQEILSRTNPEPTKKAQS